MCNICVQTYVFTTEKVKKGKKELQILQNANTSLKTKHEKLVASLLEIFKDGEDIVGGKSVSIHQ